MAAAGLIKIDLLGLGMLSALHMACDLIRDHHGIAYTLASIPQDDPDVYKMIARGDTIGVFQVESRAQISTLPQLRPQRFEDLAVAASIIRPGPIQAGSKDPLLRRRRGEEPATYPHPLAEAALKPTLGVALWQEQAMQLAINDAGFTPGEADRLRKAMAAKHAPEKVVAMRERLLTGMAERNIPPGPAEKIVSMIEAFSDYGFPQSHAQSMAGLIYASAWLRLHHPAALIAGIMAHQPMGFYDTQTLIGDATRRGITVQGPDVQISGVHAILEPDTKPGARHPAIRRGLTSITGLAENAAEGILSARQEQPFTGLDDFALRTRLPARLLERLATAGALESLGAGHRTGRLTVPAERSMRPVSSTAGASRRVRWSRSQMCGANTRLIMPVSSSTAPKATPCAVGGLWRYFGSPPMWASAPSGRDRARAVVRAPSRSRWGRMWWTAWAVVGVARPGSGGWWLRPGRYRRSQGGAAVSTPSASPRPYTAATSDTDSRRGHTRPAFAPAGPRPQHYVDRCAADGWAPQGPPIVRFGSSFRITGAPALSQAPPSYAASLHSKLDRCEQAASPRQEPTRTEDSPGSPVGQTGDPPHH